MKYNKVPVPVWAELGPVQSQLVDHIDGGICNNYANAHCVRVVIIINTFLPPFPFLFGIVLLRLGFRLAFRLEFRLWFAEISKNKCTKLIYINFITFYFTLSYWGTRIIMDFCPALSKRDLDQYFEICVSVCASPIFRPQIGRKLRCYIVEAIEVDELDDVHMYMLPQ